ncbi:MAG: DUF420 domain-containing protein [Bacteroidia bacterium]|nr:DUF420 domain-containing protein [Bacteroidia bacterium]
MNQTNDKVFVPVIGVLSVVVPIVVALLIFLPRPEVSIENLKFLPGLNAVINSTVAILLVAGYVFIRKGNIRMHKTMMLSAFVLSILFLVSYITYHYGAEHVVYNGTGMTRVIYLIILLTHILLSVVVVPLALFSIYRGLSESYEKHRRIAKVTLPVWLYVAVTGVIVYLMAHPFNPQG